MATLKERLGNGAKRDSVVDDACRVLDQEVADKSGLTGIAIKGAYKLVQGVKPGFVRHVVDNLLDDFLDALEPTYQEALAKNIPPGQYLRSNADRVADALLAVTDRRAQKADNALIKKTYEKLRPSAKKQVEAAAPRLADLLQKHAPPAA